MARTFNYSVSDLLPMYEATTAADFVDYGFTIGNKVYRIIMKALPAWLVTMDKESTSHGGAEKIRINPTEINKRKLLAMGAKYIGEYIDIIGTGKNEGVNYEKYVTEKARQEWKKDSVPYYMDGDLTVNNIKYQIKFNRASLANAETIKKAVAVKG